MQDEIVGNMMVSPHADAKWCSSRLLQTGGHVQHQPEKLDVLFEVTIFIIIITNSMHISSCST